MYGKTDADAVFGLMYAQCEDNYWQIEETYIRRLGRLAELYGQSRLLKDITVAVFQCCQKGKGCYYNASLFIKKLCDAAAAGINFYLQTHPLVQRRLLQHYEPCSF